MLEDIRTNQDILNELDYIKHKLERIALTMKQCQENKDIDAILKRVPYLIELDRKLHSITFELTDKITK